jgi:3-oxoacyl-[acyl-carrier protein] reductase
MSIDLQNKRILITGAGGGLGQSHAVLLAERGADIIVHDINRESALETARVIQKLGQEATLLISNIRETNNFLKDVQEIGRVDVLVNNAGVGGLGRKIEDIDPGIFDEMFDVHVKGTFFAAQAVLPQMKERKKGKIINTSSIFAMGGHYESSHYAAAKSAISGLTKSWARELAAWNITVNAVAPGFVETDMTRCSTSPDQIENLANSMPLGRLCEPLDISHTVAWLASSDTDMITGQIISPNAGSVIVGF